MKTPYRVAFLLTLGTLPCIIFKKPYLRWTWALVLITPLPILFIPTRGGCSLYVIQCAIAIYAAGVSVETIQAILRRGGSRIAAVGTPLLVLAACLPLCARYWEGSRDAGQALRESVALNQAVIREVAAMVPGDRRGLRLLFMNDPFAPDWDLYFTVALVAHDPEIKIVILRDSKHVSDPDTEGYDEAFRFEGSKLIRVYERFRIEPTAPALPASARMPPSARRDWPP